MWVRPDINAPKQRENPSANGLNKLLMSRSTLDTLGPTFSRSFLRGGKHIAVTTYAHSTESVNGVGGKKVPGSFAIPAPGGSEGTVGSGGGADEHPWS